MSIIAVSPVTPATIIPAYGLETKVNVQACRAHNAETGVSVYTMWDFVHGCQFDVWNGKKGRREYEQTPLRHWTKRDWKAYTRGQKWYDLQVFALRLRDGHLDWDAKDVAEQLAEQLGTIL